MAFTIGLVSGLVAGQTTDTNKSSTVSINTALPNIALSGKNLDSKSLTTVNDNSDKLDQISNLDKSYWSVFSLIMAAFLLEIIRILRIYCIIKGWKGKLFTAQEKIIRIIFTILFPLMIDGLIIFVFGSQIIGQIKDLFKEKTDTYSDSVENFMSNSGITFIAFLVISFS